MRRSIRKRLSTREPTIALPLRRDSASSCDILPASWRIRHAAGPHVAPATPSRTAADPAAPWACARWRPADPDPRRARCPGCLNARATHQRSATTPQRHPDRRRDRPDLASVFGKLGRTRRTSRSPNYAPPRSTPTAAPWTTTPPGVSPAPPGTSAVAHALELTSEPRSDPRNRQQDADRARRRRLGQGDGGDRPLDAQVARRDALDAAIVRPEINGVLAANGIEGSDVPKSVFLPEEETKWLEESAVTAALAAVSGSSSAAPWCTPRPQRRQYERHRTG